jgi:hypothetical protein
MPNYFILKLLILLYGEHSKKSEGAIELYFRKAEPILYQYHMTYAA